MASEDDTSPRKLLEVKHEMSFSSDLERKTAETDPKIERNLPSLKELQKSGYGIPKKGQCLLLHQVVKPHIESFDWMVHFGLTKASQCLRPVEFETPGKERISISLSLIRMGVAKISEKNIYSQTSKLYPSECRMSGSTYSAPLQGCLILKINGEEIMRHDKTLCHVPVMLKSRACNLRGLSPAELIKHGEEPEEMGGIFIVNGNEKIIRQTLQTRRNYPICVKKDRWKQRGKGYTEFGIQLCSQKPDKSSVTSVLHYISRGAAVFSFVYMRQQYFMPVCMLMKAISNADDYSIYKHLIKGKEDDAFFKSSVVSMLRELAEQKLFTQTDVLKLIGENFRVKLDELPPWYTDIQISEFLIQECVLPHLSRAHDKINLLVSMTRKLFSFAAGECCEENLDSTAIHEILPPGHLYLMVLSERLQMYLTQLKHNILKKVKDIELQVTKEMFMRCSNLGLNIGHGLVYLLATGNIMSKSGLGLMQLSGFAILADRLNFYRYISHFRAVHRGSFFATMRTSTVRKLLPEAFGFICPVHTPDGAPCGLLNHLSATCTVVNHEPPIQPLEQLIYSSGVIPLSSDLGDKYKNYLEVLLNGKVMGLVHLDDVMSLVKLLRKAKWDNDEISNMLEVACVLPTVNASQYPGLFLSTSMGRMMRAVMNIESKKVELIGTLEQVYLDISINKNDVYRDPQGQLITTHYECAEHSMLSYLAGLTPFSDFNQSPRNMYQCQMGKQTMGTPLHAYPYRTDNKLYRILTPQSPLVRPKVYDLYNMDEYPLGTNAVVAVISYTGYDMEDAFILNKASFERGFAHGYVIKSEMIDLTEKEGRITQNTLLFSLTTQAAEREILSKYLGADGLPHIGLYLNEGDPYYSVYNTVTGEYQITKYKSSEPAYIDHVKIVGGVTGTSPLNKVNITLRVVRNPIVGDKFASRAGQKGICSQLWPSENMPFTESGLTPDILFNPHGYPSRMTIGMMIETMAGKASAHHAIPFDATPFTFSEDDSAVDYFGRCLQKAGYNYYGCEKLYSGQTGVEMEADIFIGVVYYQRLRHMVSDKFQVRTTGTRDQLTRQPVKGRAKGGGVRFGEMERDGLISHGASYLIQDRLQTCSDLSKVMVCTSCGSLLSPMQSSKDPIGATGRIHQWNCVSCQDKTSIAEIEIPYSFRYLVNELASVNLKLTLEVK